VLKAQAAEHQKEVDRLRRELETARAGGNATYPHNAYYAISPAFTAQAAYPPGGTSGSAPGTAIGGVSGQGVGVGPGVTGPGQQEAGEM
jgi:hypothetical protein